MTVFSAPDFDDHEQVVFCRDPESGLTAIIALHNTNRGPALGGCRMWNYDSEDAAITDVLRLSRGMTYKNALADLPYGGGKSVIIGDARKVKTPAMMRAMGRMVDRLGGRYLIAEDVGTTPADMAEINRETPYVKGVAGEGGDPSPATAYGVFCGIRASVERRFGIRDLSGVRIALQGLGHVGYDLAEQLHAAGARLVVTDIDGQAVDRAVRDFDAEACDLDQIYDAEVDVFVPCALGAILNETTIPRLKAAVVAGSANNQLARPEDAARLTDRGILYAPDYVINAGGVIHIHHEGVDYDRQTAFAHIGRIGSVLRDIYDRAERDDVPTAEAADRLARERFAKRAMPRAA